MIEAVFLVLFVAGGLALLGLWTRDFADLLWMFAARKLLTGVAALAVLTIVLGIVALIPGLSASSATGFCLGFLLTPTLAKWLANFIARWKAGGQLPGAPADPQEAAPLSGFVFAEERAAQADAYEAPRVAQ